jgi:hypothetical protein
MDLVICHIPPVYIKQFGLTEMEGGTEKALFEDICYCLESPQGVL